MTETTIKQVDAGRVSVREAKPGTLTLTVRSAQKPGRVMTTVTITEAQLERWAMRLIRAQEFAG